MSEPLRVLIIEDSEFDAMVLVSVLRAGGYQVDIRRVESPSQMEEALAQPSWDVILADYNLPEFSAPAALQMLQESGLDIPFIIISGGIGEDVAVAAMKAGAHDYLMKGHLARLVPVVEREIREAKTREARRKAETDLRSSELRHRLVWENCTDAVIIMDTSSCILYVNPAVRSVFGYEPSEMLGQNLTAFFPGESSSEPRFLDALRNRKQELANRILETPGLRKDGSTMMTEIAYNDMTLDGSRLYVAFVRDVTERVEAEHRLRENEEQFRIARSIQERLYPKGSPHLKGFEIAGASRPAAAAGGDYFDFLPIQNNRLGVVVGDVTGHGMGPALLMAETRAYLRILANNRDDPGTILSRANAVLSEDLDMDRFITLFFGVLDPETRCIHYGSAGHSPCYHLDREGKLKSEMLRTGIPLGMARDTQYQSADSLPLESGDLLLLVTDGIEETFNSNDEFFGRERLLEVAQNHRDQSAEKMVQAVFEAATQFAEGEAQEDDFTILVIKVL